MNLIQRPVTFIKEVRQELSKVAWSTRRELLDATFVVITVTVIAAAGIGVIDLILSKVLSIMFMK